LSKFVRLSKAETKVFQSNVQILHFLIYRAYRGP